MISQFLNFFYQTFGQVPQGATFSAIDLCGIAMFDFMYDFAIEEGKNNFLKQRKIEKGKLECYKRANQVMHADLETAIENDTIVERSFWEIVFGTEEYQKQDFQKLNDFLNLKYSVSKDNLKVSVSTELDHSRGNLSFEIDENGYSNAEKFNYVFEKKDEKQLKQEQTKSYDPSFA